MNLRRGALTTLLLTHYAYGANMHIPVLERVIHMVKGRLAH